MRDFLINFLECLAITLVITLGIGGIVGPTLLAAIVSPWFGLGYIITIPLTIACIDYLADNFW